MARMRAVDAAAAVMRKEGVSTVFGVPGAAINPLYSAMKKEGGFKPNLFLIFCSVSTIRSHYSKNC